MKKILLCPILLAGCCTAPAIDIISYRYMQKDPSEAVRFFQLAVELGEWKEAAGCLTRENTTGEKNRISPFELWVASSMRMPELGNMSLNQIVVGAYLIKEISREKSKAIVAVLSHPKEDIVQRYDLVLVKRGEIWVIDIDRTVDLNAQPPETLP